MVFAKCKDIEELRIQCKKEYDQYISEKGRDFFFRSNIQTLDEKSDFNQIMEEVVKEHREDSDICMQVYTDFRKISISKENILRELQETQDYLQKLPGEQYWWMKMKEGKEKYLGLLFWAQYVQNNGEKQGLLYTAVHK